MHALIQDGQAARYPYSVDQFRADFRNISLPLHPTQDQLDAVGLFQVSLMARPQTSITEVAEDSAQNIGGAWTQVWTVRPATPEEEAMNKAALLAEYDRALTAHFDATAQARRYDNRITCALRAGYAGPFQAEGQAFAQWMDACNAQAYSLLAQVQAGTAPAPESVGAFLAALPVMTWPD